VIVTASAGPVRPVKFPAFDGLRAIAALLVIAYHVSLAEGLSRTGPLAPLAAELKGGVTIFFVISGFLLYLPYARAIRDEEALPSWRDYARRRVLRIVPGYWFALTILGLATLAGSVFTVGWWRYYGLAQIYSQSTLTGGLSVAWSLCVEVTFYVCLPLFARAMAALCRRRAATPRPDLQLVVLAGIGLFSLLLREAVCRSLIGPVPGPGVVLETALPGALDWFAIGLALAVVAAAWETDPGQFRPVAWLARNAGLSWVLACACFTAGAAAQHGDLFLPLYGVTTHLALGLASAFLVIPAIARDRQTRPARLLSTPLLAWLGMVSYGIYLWHDPLLRAIHGSVIPSAGHTGGVGQTLGLLLAVTLGAIALGAASWYLVERPAQRLAARARLGFRLVVGRRPGLTRP
jgi:peptidoglycan/LPS O-acetylase OafA/YrhL